MNGQTSRKTNEMPDCTKGGWECRKHLRYETKPKDIKWRSRHFSQVIREGRFGCPRIAQVISSEELGTMSKNNLWGITLVRGPIWGSHSLPLKISCHMSISSVFPQFKWTSFHGSFLSRVKMNSIKWRASNIMGLHSSAALKKLSPLTLSLPRVT